VFTGIVEERGRVRSADAGRLVVEAPTVAADADLGASVSVSGVCLAVVDRSDDALTFDLAPETVARSSLGTLRQGDAVNLERPLTLATRLGGHLVQGHVDGVATVEAVEGNGSGASMRLALPDRLMRYVVDKGSIAVDGVSLTVARVEDRSVSVALIPHTLTVTTLGDRGPGDRVNIEVDVLAKYVEGMTRRDR
jgi:riboflavin synthase